MQKVLSNLLFISAFFLIMIYIIIPVKNYDLRLINLLDIVPFYIVFQAPVISLIYSYTKFGKLTKNIFTLLNIIIGILLLWLSNILDILPFHN